MEARFAEALHRYCKEHSSHQEELLWALERETHLKTLAPQMISGPLQGKLLEFLSKMIQPKFILEIDLID
jgi:caffeoyl-CoA O-methyltransferase